MMEKLGRVAAATGMVLALGVGAFTPIEADAELNHTASAGADLFSGEAGVPAIAAHRGQWRKAPENSVAAVVHAVEDGAEIVEIDVQRTLDGELVLMHDATVDRTTDGTGRVDEMTLAEIQGLRLREGQGNGPAPVTGHAVPTLADVLDAVRGMDVILNLDKGWQHREQLYAHFEERGMVDQALFKGAPSAGEAEEFMDAHPEALYMHVVNDSQAGDFEQFGERMPVAFELVFDNPEDLQAQPEYFDKVNAVSSVWLNAMWNSLASGHTDEASLRDPELGWQWMVDRGAGMIQTDNVEMLDSWRAGADVTRWGMSDESVRIQAEDFIDDPALYFDVNPANECGARAIRNPGSPVDACNLDGAHIVQYIRDGEWFTLPVTLEEGGAFSLTMRHSADTEPGGTVSVDYGEGYGTPHPLGNPTHNRAFTVSDLGTVTLAPGARQIKLRFTHPDYASVDWIQLDPLENSDPAHSSDSSSHSRSLPFGSSTLP